MKTLTAAVSLKYPIGTIRRINGGNLGPNLQGEMSGMNIRKEFSELNLAVTRLHDVPLANPNCRLVDISSIFPLSHLDPLQPENYDFRQTDDYLRNCYSCGCPVYYRLGESIDHTEKKYFITPPEDVSKWIEIASNIIRHYNDGWANGFHYGIKYWEIWNEPEIQGNKHLAPDAKPLMWLGTEAQFLTFFRQVICELKQRFPHLKFGGPSHCGFSEKQSIPFLHYCAKNEIPLDFYSFHCYADDPCGQIQRVPHLARKALDDLGYTDTEIHLNEWHYFPGDWQRLRYDPEYREYMFRNVLNGLDAAAFVASVLTLWQDTPLDMSCYYTTASTAWGCLPDGAGMPAKPFYSLTAFGEIVRYPNRLSIKTLSSGLTVLAGQDNNETAVLFSAFKTGPAKVVLQTDCKIEEHKLSFRLLDEQHNLTPGIFSCSENTISFSFTGNSCVGFLLCH